MGLSSMCASALSVHGDVGWRGLLSPRCMRIVYEIIERSIDKHGQILMIPDVELNMFWTNLGWSDDDVIASYHAHGKCEQYHSELKTDMDVERLPSGKLATNALVPGTGDDCLQPSSDDWPGIPQTQAANEAEGSPPEITDCD